MSGYPSRSTRKRPQCKTQGIGLSTGEIEAKAADILHSPMLRPQDTRSTTKKKDAGAR